MVKVIGNLSVSLDGFVAGPSSGPELPLGKGGEQLFKWYFNGNTAFLMPDGKMTMHVSTISAKILDEAIKTAGALITGRNTFDIAKAWGGNHPMDVPVFVLTHNVPAEWVKESSPFTFVTDGIGSAVEKAKKVAGEKNVAVGTANTIQQCLKVGLLDEIHIDLVPILLGGGIRLFEQFSTKPVELENIGIIEAPNVTHLRFRVVK